MRIQNLTINGFGIFSGQQVKELGPGLNVFMGDNEAGKSTLLEFIRNVLFGYPTGKGSGVYSKHPIPAGATPGGSILLRRDDTRLWELFWQPKTKEGLQTLFEQTPEGLYPLDIKEYKQFSAEMSRELYAAVYGFSLEELQEISKLKNETRVADLLYGAGFGLGDVSLPEIMKNLSEKWMSNLWKPKGQKTINNLLIQLKELQQKIQAEQEHLPKFNQIKTELEEVRAKQRQSQGKLELARANLNASRDLIRLKNQLPELAAVYSQLNALEHLELTPEADQFFSEHSLEKLKSWHKNATELQEKLNALAQNQAKLALNLVHDPDDAAVQSAEADIKKLQEQKGRYNTEKEELEKIRPKIEILTGQPAFTALFDQETRATPALLSARANHILKLWQELKHLAAEYQLITESMENTEAGSTLPSLYEAGQQQLAFKNFLSPANPAILLAGLASSAALAYAFYASISSSPWVWAGLAAFWGLLGAIFIKARKTQSKKLEEQELHASRNDKISAILVGAKPLLRELKPLLSQIVNLPSGGGDDRCILETLEILSPEKCLLLESLLLEWHAHLPNLTERQAILEAGLQKIEQESITLMKRIFPDMTPEPDSYLKNLQTLTHALEKAQQAQLEASKATGQLESQASQFQEAQTSLQEIKTKLELAFKTSGSSSIEQLEGIYSSWEKKQHLASKASTMTQTLLTQAAEIIKQMPAGQNFTPPEYTHPEMLLSWLKDENPGSLQARHEQLETGLRSCEQEHEQLAREEGRLNQEAKSLMTEDELETLTLEREVLLEKTRTLSRQWSVASLALYYLTEAKRAFEAKHQTGVMKEASAFFKEITGGAYLGLDPSAPENSFAVLAATGESRPPETLSRGTREQLYLALRLALIKNRATSAEPFPLLMDDVLVNFDPARLRRAVDTILTLASTHQILYFTCQPHLAPEFLERAKVNQVDSRLFEIKNGTINPA